MYAEAKLPRGTISYTYKFQFIIECAIPSKCGIYYLSSILVADVIVPFRPIFLLTHNSRSSTNYKL